MILNLNILWERGKGKKGMEIWGLGGLRNLLGNLPSSELLKYNFQMTYCAVKNQIANLELQLTYQNSVENSWSACKVANKNQF